ncbi:MAG TPA: hypothetical protein VKE50_08715 [Thermoanaerobaculia bacterium]|nr:hypothetical protein [Thermoanaerobaculia bacterium]
MKSLPRPVLIGLLGLTLLCAAASQTGRITPADRKRLMASTLRVSTKTTEIPEEVRKAFAALVHQPAFKMAEPTQPFQVGDAIEPGPPLPGRRLIFAAFDDGLCVIHYERGGIAHVYEIMTFTLSKGAPPELAWSALSQGKLPDLEALRKAVAEDKIRPGEERYW